MRLPHVTKIMVACLLAGCLFRGAAVVGQQLPDPKFDAKVAKPAYTDKHPRVLFDEGHFNVHTAKAGYKAFADLVANDGYKVTSNDKPFDAKILSDCDILVIANARGAAMRSEKPAFTDAECDAVRDWVKAGGCLLLVTDHYPTGHAAEKLSLRFDVTMSKGRTEDTVNAARGAGGPSTLLFSRDNKLLGDHAITKGRNESERINKIITFTGQSLKGPEGSVSFLQLAKTATDVLPGDNNKVISAEGRSQGLALKFGKGRVVVLGEASQISAQIAGPQNRPMGMNYPGIDNRQMVLNIMHWLSGLLVDSADDGKKPGETKKPSVDEGTKKPVPKPKSRQPKRARNRPKARNLR